MSAQTPSQFDSCAEEEDRRTRGYLSTETQLVWWYFCSDTVNLTLLQCPVQPGKHACTSYE